jgi:signal transduction histidine kinase
MRSELEVDARDPGRADTAATRRSQLDEIAGLQSMIDDLLVLARSDAGAPGLSFLAVDLDDIVLEEVRAARTPVPIDATRVSAAQVMGSADDLRRVVRNLLDNAARHARTTVAVGLVETDGMAILTVDDDGTGIPADRRTDVFERFTRLDESRTGGRGRAGLGLAIVHEIVTRHGGTVAIEDSPLNGARLTVTLPSR